MSGEELHQAGIVGARRAKVWLDMTTRADTQWVNPHKAAVRKLTFNWAKPDTPAFSFDIGGIMKGGDLEGQVFLGESKYYHVYGELATHFRKFLAQCYCALLQRPAMCDHFMFITWHPFSVKTWKDLLSPDSVAASVLEHRDRALAEADEGAARRQIDMGHCADVAERLWLIVLSDRQERELIMSPRDLALIKGRRTEEEYADA